VNNSDKNEEKSEESKEPSRKNDLLVGIVG